jgi:MoxR-like ATPase
MKPSELFEALHALITERVPLHIWGACGVGKSQIVAQVASDLGWQFLDIRAVQLDPVDLRGLAIGCFDVTCCVVGHFRASSTRKTDVK